MPAPAELPPWRADEKVVLRCRLLHTLGLVLGFFYRESAKAHDFSGSSQLTATPHVLALGTLFFLIVIVLDKQFALTSGRWFNAFFWTYNAGLVMTVARESAAAKQNAEHTVER
ncbi:DUF2871 family protein [Nocardia tengchongensis]|uniref:DUF2871 family protein n=1 Tax=Nocardia tengchongensis TaxID=2055889 RepID=UPI0036D18FD3